MNELCFGDDYISKLMLTLSLINILYFIVTIFIDDNTKFFTTPLLGPPFIAFILIVIIVINLLFKLFFRKGNSDEEDVPVPLRYAIGINFGLIFLGQVVFFNF